MLLSDLETRFQRPYSQKFKKLRGKTVLIVGDARQMGRSTAALLASGGAQVYFAAQSELELRGMLAAAGGDELEMDGQVVEAAVSTDVKRFFDKAQARLGHIDALISFISVEDAPGDDQDMRQLLFTQEAIPYLKNSECGQMIHVGSGQDKKFATSSALSESGFVAALRRQAREMGIHVTLIEPENGADGLLNADDVARSVANSLEQTFGVDVVFLQGKIQ